MRIGLEGITLGFIESVDKALADKGLAFVSSIIDIALTFAAAIVVVKLTRALLNRVVRKRREGRDDSRMRRIETAATVTESIVRYVVWFVAIAVAIGSLGLKSVMTSLLAAAGIGGVILGIGAQSLISDIVNGVFMLFEDQYAVGDYIKAAGVTGTVESIAVRTTAIRQYTGELTVIPNGSIKDLTNYSRSNSLAVVDIPIAAIEDARKAMDVIREAAKAYHDELGDIAAGEAEVLGANAIEQGAVVIRTVMSVKPLEHWGAQRELLAREYEALKAAGISLASTRVAIIESGSAGNGGEK